METVAVAVTAVIAAVVGIGPVVIGMLHAHERTVVRSK
jgi:hypothetical protein